MITFIRFVRIDNEERYKNLLATYQYYNKVLPDARHVFVEEEIYSKLNDFPFREEDVHLTTNNEGLWNKCAGYNLGAVIAKDYGFPEHMCFLDVDVIIHPEQLKKAIEKFDDDTGVVLPFNCMCLNVDYHVKREFEASEYDYEVLKNYFPKTPRSEIQNLHREDHLLVGSIHCEGGAPISRYDKFVEFGGFNPNFMGWGYEDNEFILRPRKLGFKIKRVNLDDSPLWHLPHDGPGSSEKETNPHHEINRLEASKVNEMSVDKLQEYIKTWKFEHKTKQRVNLLDTNFVGEPSSCHKGENQYIEWIRKPVKVGKTVFLTDNELVKVSKLNSVEKKVAWILEPRAIHPHVYDWISQNNRLFDYVLTFDKELLDRGENFLFYPHGRCWIKNLTFDPENKTKDISLIASTKAHTEGHRLRHEVAKRFGDKIDLFGSAYKFVENKEEALQQYRFSIIIENSIADYYWTEKIVDSFATLTIPVFWGTKTIDRFFNKDGIIQFETLDELEEIIPTLTKEKYDSMLEDAYDNYDYIQDYLIPEDWIYKNYPFLFKDMIPLTDFHNYNYSTI